MTTPKANAKLTIMRTSPAEYGHLFPSEDHKRAMDQIARELMR